MKLNELSQEEIAEMTYSDLAIAILNEKGTKLKVVDIFKKICTLKGLTDREFENKIADFFEIISTDKNFIVLDKGFCDIRTRHNLKITVEEDDEIADSSSLTSEDEEDIIEEQQDDENEDIFYDSSSDEDDVEDADDDLGDFEIIEDDEEASL